MRVVFGSFWLGLMPWGNRLITQSMVGNATEAYDQFGSSVSAGDFNGDGYDDLIVGAPFETYAGVSATGIVHVIPGSWSGPNTARWQVWSQMSFDECQRASFFGWSLPGHPSNLIPWIVE